MNTSHNTELFRAAAVKYKQAAEAFLWAAYHGTAHEIDETDLRGFRSPLYESFREAQSRLVVSCHPLPAAALLLQCIEEGQRPILAIHNARLKAVGETRARRKSRELDLSLVLDGMEQIQRLDLFAGLWQPIKTRVFSNWYWSTEIREQLGKDGDAMPRRTWQKHRRRLGRQIESHPQSGAQKVRLTRMANDDLGLNLPEFHRS